MDLSFKKELSQEEHDEIRKFYESVGYVTIEQFPEWRAIGGNKNVRFFLAKDNNKIVSFSIINETHYPLFKVAQINFGPLFKNADDLIASIQEIRNFYKKEGFFYLAIQLAMPTGSVSDYIEYKLNQRIKIQYAFDRNNWSSLVVNLDKPIEDIFKGFSKGHKSAIKSSSSRGIISKTLTSSQEVQALSEIYVNMNIARGLSSSAQQTTNLFSNIFTFFRNEEKGIFMGVFDEKNVMLGGIILIFQGKTVRYYKGASDHNRKDVSILHVAIYEAIKLSKNLGYETFDLWGYNHMVDEHDQIFFINRFKKGFSNNYIFYPKVMHLSLKPGGYYLYKKLMGNKDKFNFLKDLKNKITN